MRHYLRLVGRPFLTIFAKLNKFVFPHTEKMEVVSEKNFFEYFDGMYERAYFNDAARVCGYYGLSA